GALANALGSSSWASAVVAAARTTATSATPALVMWAMLARQEGFMSNHALYLVRMDVAHDHDATFNEVYDREHVPNLRGVPGVRRAARYRQPSPTEPRYLS